MINATRVNCDRNRKSMRSFSRSLCYENCRYCIQVLFHFIEQNSRSSALSTLHGLVTLALPSCAIKSTWHALIASDNNKNARQWAKTIFFFEWKLLCFCSFPYHIPIVRRRRSGEDTTNTNRKVYSLHQQFVFCRVFCSLFLNFFWLPWQQFDASIVDSINWILFVKMKHVLNAPQTKQVHGKKRYVQHSVWLVAHHKSLKELIHCHYASPWCACFGSYVTLWFNSYISRRFSVDETSFGYF